MIEKIQAVITIIATIFSVAIPIIAVMGFRYSRHEKLRKEYEFSKEFLCQVSSENMHLYALGKGYQAISGTAKIKTKEIHYVLNLEDPVVALSQIKRSYHILANTEGQNGMVWEFRGIRNKRWVRCVERFFYIILYASCSLLALSPLLISNFYGQQVNFKLFVLVFPPFALMACIAVYSFRVLQAAEGFLKQKIRID